MAETRPFHKSPDFFSRSCLKAGVLLYPAFQQEFRRIGKQVSLVIFQQITSRRPLAFLLIMKSLPVDSVFLYKYPCALAAEFLPFDQHSFFFRAVPRHTFPYLSVRGKFTISFLLVQMCLF
jgi:hypothetical protein